MKPEPSPPPGMRAQRWVLGGRVQGVGFRPFVYRLAHRLGLTGWVRNGVGQVEILAQGPGAALAAFGEALTAAAPPLARPAVLASSAAPWEPLDGFAILASAADTAAAIHVPPDYYTCDDCLRELADPGDRRYRYPFINCTQCGPRYTLITRLPYDRPNTTMAGFPLCPACRREYQDPLNRRFHAEPVACPACGPQLQFYDESRGVIDDTPAALAAAVDALRAGGIIAVKGVGGYHLLCDAADDRAIARLRRTKPRPDKPLAVMFPARGPDGLAAARTAVELEAVHAERLRDPARPIVLAPRRPESPLSPGIAPGLAEIGVFLPYSPLHQLLLADFGAPLVATSGNVGGEPVLTDNVEAEQRLAAAADGFLHHDRPIERPADDSVFRVIAGRPRPLRLGRGGAPLERELPRALPEPVLALGGHMKNTVALAWDRRVVVSPHIGDLGTPRSLAVFEQVLQDLQRLYGVQARRLVCDAHPGYASRRWARAAGLPVSEVYHHYAHASQVAGEFPEVTRWLVFTWDGAGYGADGSLWGGEALLGRPGDWRRVGRFRRFFLPGGEKAGREPWRSAVALCWETGLDWRGAPEDTALLHEAWRRRLNCPATGAVGRLFDAAASLTGLVHRASFEGQGPMQLEAVALADAPAVPLALRRGGDGLWESDWSSLLPMLLDAGLPVAERAGRFHASLAAALVAQACAVRAEHGIETVGLGGGVFQNRLLSEQVMAGLRRQGFAVHLPEQLPCNDGGLAYGQVVEIGAILSQTR